MITAERLRELLHYDPHTGIFTWRVRTSNARAGDRAGCVKPDGYRYVGIDSRSYLAHRLAFLYMTGAWPVNEGDHENRIRDDNRWENLRDATHQQNMVNKTVRKDSTTGIKGVRLHKSGKFRAGITIDGRRIHLGMYDTIEAAADSYAAAANDNFGAFALTGAAANDNVALEQTA